MPIQLTKPLDPGDFDSGTYDHVSIMRQLHDSRRSMIQLELSYGTLIDGKFKEGEAQPASVAYPRSLSITDSDYLDLITTYFSKNGELIYAAVKRGLYERLQAQYVALAGIIV